MLKCLSLVQINITWFVVHKFINISEYLTNSEDKTIDWQLTTLKEIKKNEVLKLFKVISTGNWDMDTE